MIEQSEGATKENKDRLSIDHVFALRRSGHHAIMAWLRSCYEASGMTTAHINNVHEVSHEQSAEESRVFTGDDVLTRAENSDVLLVNYEDFAYSLRHESPAYTDLQTSETRIPTQNIVITRDYYNLMASRLMKTLTMTKGTRFRSGWLNLEDVAPVWVEYAQLLSTDDQAANDFPLCINYNRWFTETEYRNDIAERLGVTNVDHAREKIHDFGGGSSFDNKDYDGKASKMNVLERWRDLDPKLIPTFLKLLDDSRDLTEELNRQLFGIHYSRVLGSLAISRTAMDVD